MNELTVVQSNDLIASSYKLDIDEMRLLNLALTKVDSRKPNIGIVEIYPDEFANMFNLNKLNVWRNMKNALLSIMQKPVKIRFLDENEKKKDRVISWLGATTYFVDQNDGAKIELEFTSQITPYLFELQGNFTAVNFEYAAQLNTPFSFRLYQWLVREYRIKKGEFYDLTMTLEDIKISSQLDKNYSVWGNFKARVIDPAIDAINQRTNLSVSYIVIKKSNKVHSIKFTYIDEMKKATASIDAGEAYTFKESKPMRPRLLRRPKVKKGSHEEGEWQKANFKILEQYQKDLKSWDKIAKLTIPDLRKLVAYSKLFSIKTHKKAQNELEQRTKKQ